jgi:hypothetical protein
MDPRTFENYQGVVYYCFNRIKNNTAERIKPGEQLHIGIDFNVGKMAGIVFVIRNALLFALDEFSDIFDTPAMIQKIEERYPEHGITVYPDASGNNRKSVNASQTDLALLRKQSSM